MTFKTYASMALSTLLVTSTLMTTPALAQRGQAIKPITIPCCKCIGGEGSATSINTGNAAGSVPYQVSGPGVNNPVAVPVTYWTNTLSPAGWVQPNNSNGANIFPAGLYNYTVRFVVPKCTIPMKVVVGGKFAADNGAKVFFDTNPNPIATQFPTPYPYGFAPGNEGSFMAMTMAPGTHTLRFEVQNQDGPSGLVVQAIIRTICSKDLEMQPPCLGRGCQTDRASPDSDGDGVPEVQPQ